MDNHDSSTFWSLVSGILMFQIYESPHISTTKHSMYSSINARMFRVSGYHRTCQMINWQLRRNISKFRSFQKYYFYIIHSIGKNERKRNSLGLLLPIKLTSATSHFTLHLWASFLRGRTES